MKKDRSKFVYRSLNYLGGSYGMTTDIYMLPFGTKFMVDNGAWNGEIVEKDGRKFIRVIETGRMFELNEDTDYGLVISINK